ncbi:hypothetical protein E1B28_013238 [Marasmius oreades]|uniref:Uncharacterized protein n=1 Tax=Marasmius oreades TaxID=181124 RepID=A0A9P7ULU5_9AGAR|nr:uncharacterized protein E1B28_013238 [Marasmius oreades]KAG7087257.1 hypothetical protein E1B28_013238 [Marasmius oreades]
MTLQTSETLLELVNFLTRPLTKAYPVLTIMCHRQVLQKQLQSAFFSNRTTCAPFTLFFSPILLPPAPVYAACLMSGVRWVEWVRLLAPHGMCVFVMEGAIKVKAAKAPELTTVWSKDDSSIKTASTPTSQESGSSSPSSSLSRLQTALKSVQLRNTSTTQSPSKPQTQASGVVTRRGASRRTPFQPKPTRLSQVIMVSDDEAADSDSDSDAGSTTSSSSSLFSTALSSGSVTSTASSDCGTSSTSHDLPELNLDLLRAAIKSRSTISTKEKASNISQRPTRSQFHDIQRCERRLIDPTKTDVTRYNYKGGQTAVMTGGVMLGAVCSKQRC